MSGFVGAYSAMMKWDGEVWSRAGKRGIVDVDECLSRGRALIEKNQ